MRLLISGACGFVGSTLIRTWAERGAAYTIIGIDNLSRPGSELNRQALRRLGVKLFHADIRSASDFETIPAVDWVIDAAANPSVLAGRDGGMSSRQLAEHNLLGTLNLLEYCRQQHAGFILLSTSRVYSIAHLSAIRVERNGEAFVPAPDQHIPGLTTRGVAEDFSTEPPLSLYGATKRASGMLALEYGDAFEMPVWINRCGVMAGGGQFARQDQGIFSFWIHSWAQRRPLSYIGFGGTGFQVRDCLHPRDLVPLLDQQMQAGRTTADRVVNVSGGTASAVSLKACSDWCANRFGPHSVAAVDGTRLYDIPWLVLDASRAGQAWNWTPATSRDDIFEEIARHADAHPEWLQLTTA
jgi:CDP-paratose 2-epimerase